jgi:DNA polymerase III epsilon subunit-like protein
VLKGLLKVKDVQIGVVLRLETTNVVLVLEVSVIEFDVIKVVQDAR